MTSTEIWIAVALSLAVNECCELSPWAARRLVRWSAHRRYTDPDRAAMRAEELAAFIDDRPGKLLTACGFAAVAVAVATLRALLKTVKTTRRDIDLGAWASRLIQVLGAGLVAWLGAGQAAGLGEVTAAWLVRRRQRRVKA